MTPAGAAEFVVETHREGEEIRRATAVLQRRRGRRPSRASRTTSPTLLAAHPVELDGAEMRDWYDASAASSTVRRSPA